MRLLKDILGLVAMSAIVAAMLLVGVVREADRMAAEKSWVARAAARMEQTADAREVGR